MRLSTLCTLGLAALAAAAPKSPRPGAPKRPVYAGPILGPPPPHFVAYSDQSLFGIPGPKDLQGFNTLILAFLLADGPADQAAAWAALPPGERAARRAALHAHNVTLLVSAFGATDAPTTHGRDPAALARDMARFVRAHDLDGIDVDYEDFAAVAHGTAVPWLTTFTRELRARLPAGAFVLTHAPVAPWFARGQPYAALHAAVGHLVDWYHVQFYSQGRAYTDCAALVRRSGGDFPGTSLLEIVASGIPQEKLVLGKPANAAAVGLPGGGSSSGSSGGSGGGTQVADGGGGGGSGGTQVAGGTHVADGGTHVAEGGTQMAGGGTRVAGGGGGGGSRVAGRDGAKIDPHINGFLETDTLARCVLDAKNEGWNAGVMVWEYPQAGKEWIQDVRALAWPYKQHKVRA